MAALALVYNAMSTFSESDLRHLMETIVSMTPNFTEDDSDSRPPPTWTTTDRATVMQVKEWLKQSMPWDTKGSTTPVIHVGMHHYSIYTTSKALSKWRSTLCASKDDKNPAPLLTPSWDPRSKKLRFTLMLARLARLVINEFSTMNAQLQAAVDVLPMEAVTRSSPTKVEIKKVNKDLAADNAALTAHNTNLQCALDSKIRTYVDTVPRYIFLNAFLQIFLVFSFLQ